MTVFFDNNPDAVALVLNIILQRNDLVIESLQVQKKEKSAGSDGRDVIMDVFASDSDGTNYDIEIQRSDRGAGRRRARFLSGVLDSRMLKSGQNFDEICESYVIFITENDVMGKGKPIYHVNRHIEESDGELFGDGNHIIYVNGAYKNDSDDIGRLMHDFRATKPDEMYYDILKSGMEHYKGNERGTSMNKVLEEYGKNKEMMGVIKVCRSLNLTDSQIVSKLVELYGISKESAEKLLSLSAA